MASALGVVGLINVQFAIRGETIYVLEVNPRASRTVPFVSKAIGLPLAKIATAAMLGRSLEPYARIEERELAHIAVKESVFPFIKFPGVDVVLGPEMKSTGEVMGIDRDFRKAYLKSQAAAGEALPTSGAVFISVKNRDKRPVTTLAKRLSEMGFSLVATTGTARVLERHGMTVELIHKVGEGYRPNVIDLIKRGHIALALQHARGRPGPEGLGHHPPHGRRAERSLLHDRGRHPGRDRRDRGLTERRAPSAEPSGVSR
jgi:carbamoyl-phosphate synthase large subunit